MNIQVGDSYILPRDLQIDSRNIRTLQGKKHRKEKVLQAGTEVAIISMNNVSGEIGFTDGEYRYYTSWAKLSGALRYLHLGYHFYFQNGRCMVKDLIQSEIIETFEIDPIIDLKTFRLECERRAKNYKRHTST